MVLSLFRFHEEFCSYLTCRVSIYGPLGILGFFLYAKYIHYVSWFLDFINTWINIKIFNIVSYELEAM